ncbi:MAG: DNA internalization-related competence protein ComEC/Rec2 [bacterium]
MQSRPALKVLIIFTAGVLLGKFFDFSIVLALFLCGISFFGAFTFWYADKGKVCAKEVCLVIALMLTGAILYELKTRAFPEDHIVHYTNSRQAMAIEGVIVKYPERRVDKTNLTVEVEKIFFAPDVLPVHGRILVSVANANCDYQYGDEIILRGRLRKPRDRRNPGEFDYRAYLAAQGIYGIVSHPTSIQKKSSGHGNAVLREIVFPVKWYLDDFVQTHFPDRESALLHGLMIGERGEIPLALKESFANLGVIHILAVSGLHVGFIVLIFMGMLGMLRIRYPVRVALTLGGLIFYAYLTNLKPPVVRASTMGGLFLLGTVLERKTDSVNILAIAALMLLIVNPLDLFQSGFQLSFVAVASIVYLYPRIKGLAFFEAVNHRLRQHFLTRYPLELFYVSLAAFLGTLPFTIIYFHRLPVFSIPANLVIIPLAFLGLANGLLATVFNLVIPPVGQYYAATASICLHSLIRVVEWAGQFHFSHFEIFTFSATQAVFYFVGLILLLNIAKSRLARTGLVVYGLALANFVVWSGYLENNKELEVAFLDVGQGDATLLTLPGNKHLLIDAGPRGFDYDAGNRVVGPYLRRMGIREIEAIIVSHADSDHLGGVPYLMRHFRIHEVWDNGKGKSTRLFQEYLSLVDSLHINRRVLTTGAVVGDFQPVKMFVLHPSSVFLKNPNLSGNDASLSLNISYGDVYLIFIGDVEQEGERYISAFGKLLESEILKVSHHGSQTSSEQSLLEQIQPKVAVISVGEMNRFGHPDEEVLRRLRSMNALVLRTDRDSAILLRSDGKSIDRVFWK